MPRLTARAFNRAGIRVAVHGVFYRSYRVPRSLLGLTALSARQRYSRARALYQYLLTLQNKSHVASLCVYPYLYLYGVPLVDVAVNAVDTRTNPGP